MPDDLHYYQRRYWQELVQLKVQLNYLDYYEIESERIDRALGMFSAITSSSSIAVWAVWQKAQIVWAGIIAASQLLSVIKGFLPFQRRLKQISALGTELAEIFIFAEEKWYLVSEGQLTNDEIHNLTMELKKRTMKAAMKHLKGGSLPPRRRFREKAKRKVETYFKVFYGQGE